MSDFWMFQERNKLEMRKKKERKKKMSFFVFLSFLVMISSRFSHLQILYFSSSFFSLFLYSVFYSVFLFILKYSFLFIFYFYAVFFFPLFSLSVDPNIVPVEVYLASNISLQEIILGNLRNQWSVSKQKKKGNRINLRSQTKKLGIV